MEGRGWWSASLCIFKHAFISPKLRIQTPSCSYSTKFCIAGYHPDQACICCFHFLCPLSWEVPSPTAVTPAPRTLLRLLQPSSSWNVVSCSRFHSLQPLQDPPRLISSSLICKSVVILTLFHFSFSVPHLFPLSSPQSLSLSLYVPFLRTPSLLSTHISFLKRFLLKCR